MVSIREKLADLCHKQWSGWMRYMRSKCSVTSGGEWIVPSELAERWERQISTPYADLSEKERNSDRIEADKFLLLFMQHQTNNENFIGLLAAILIFYAEYITGNWSAGDVDALMRAFAKWLD